MPQNQSLDTEEIRREVIRTLRDAIRTTKKLAKETPNKTGPHGGATIKTRWFQVMAYLSQTINNVMENEDLNLAKKDIAELKSFVEQVKRGKEKPKTGPSSASG